MSPRLRSSLSEFLVVALGVAVALAADSAVERRIQAALANEALAAVYEDLGNDIAQLDTFRLPWLEDQTEARAGLGRWMESSEPIPDTSWIKLEKYDFVIGPGEEAKQM